MTEPVPGRRPARRLVLVLAPATSLVCLAVLVVVLRELEWREALHHLRRVPGVVIPLVLAAKALGFGFQAARTRVLMAPLGDLDPLPLLRSVLLGFVGNNLLPLRSGELLRVGYLARRTGASASSCLAVVTVERLLDLLHAFALCGVVVLAAAVDVPVTASLGLAAAGVGLAVALAILVARRPERTRILAALPERLLGGRWGAGAARQLRLFADGIGSLRSGRSLAGATLCSTGYWAATLLSVQLWIHGFGFDLPWYAALVVLVSLSFGVSLPSAPAHVGTYHAFAVGALALLGVEPTRAVPFAFAMHAVATVPFTVLGAAFVSGELFAPTAPSRSPWRSSAVR
jgi:hypothetical protein